MCCNLFILKAVVCWNSTRTERKVRIKLIAFKEENWLAEQFKNMDTGKRKYLPNPRENVNILSVVFFAWTIPLFRKGYSKILEVNDVFQPLKVDRSELLGGRLEKWVEEGSVQFISGLDAWMHEAMAQYLILHACFHEYIITS